MNGAPAREVAREPEAGFGLVEILVSMFLLAVLAVAFLPLLIDALRATVRTATAATATQLVSEQLDAVSLVPRTCAGLATFEAVSIPTVTDERGTIYSSFRDSAACPASGYPVAVTVRVWVTANTTPEFLVDTTTTVIVESAN